MSQSPLVSIVLMFVMLAFLFPMMIGMWKVFKKAGYPGWSCLLPVYNIIIFLKIVGKPSWWTICILSNLLATIYGMLVSKTDAMYMVLLFALNILSWVFSIWSVNMLAKSFGKEEGFTAGIIFLPFIFVPILGFGSAKYLGPFGNKTLFSEYAAGNRFDFENDKLA